jgi:hypothetical protein
MVSGRAAFDPCVAAAGNAAIGMWVRVGSWSSKRGPVVPCAVLSKLGTQRQLGELVAAGLIEDVGHGGWRLTDLSIWRSYHDEDQRPAIPLAVRLAIFERDGNQCLACGTGDDITIDHIYPWSKGGGDDPDNLQTLCRSCNSKKGARVESTVQ